jgi:hypothetical protein
LIALSVYKKIFFYNAEGEFLMTVFNLLFPVFALMGLGLISRIRGWVTPEQKEGTKDVVFASFSNFNF